MKNKQLFEENFLDIFIELRTDRVINVKLALAEIVQRHMAQSGPLSDN